MFLVEFLFALMAFLGSRDLPGFVGICAAMGLTYLYVRGSGSMRGGRRTFREMRLRMEKWWIQRKLDRARRKRGFKVIPGEGGPNVGNPATRTPEAAGNSSPSTCPGASSSTPPDGAPYRPGFGSPAQVGELFLTKFLLAFEVASLLLLIAAVGAVILARRRAGLADPREISVADVGSV